MAIVSIPKPCHQNWEDLTILDHGRHCGKCNHVVYDFSQMTDAELFNFFKKNQDVHCGRFNYTQLDREILPLPGVLFRQRLQKLVATFLAIISLRLGSAKAENLTSNNPVEYQFENDKGSRWVGESSPNYIEGKVVDEHGKPIPGALVTIDTTQLLTDSSGRFLFEMTTENMVECLLTFSYKDFMTVARNYHPAMGFTNYDVVLIERKPGWHSMGIMLPFWESIEKPELIFKSGFLLNAEQKVCLSKLAGELRNNPGIPPLQIIGFATNAEQKKLAQKRVQQVKSFLVDKEGIDATRCNTVIDSSTSSNKLNFSFEDPF